MDRADEKNWDMIQKLLRAEAEGKTPRFFSSQRTLFGIPSELDRELEAFALENICNDAVSAHEESCKAAASAASGDKAMSGQDPASTPTRVEHPLDPVFDEESRVLILGTMPSPKSRETGFYYNHPQNRFWPVMANIFGEAIPTTNEEKRELVLKHHVALWDVLASCQIEGAKDVSIAQCIPNDISVITSQVPIRAIFCTGAKAAELYDRYCKEQTGIECVRLPSTSPANAAFSLERLVKAYESILPCIQ